MAKKSHSRSREPRERAPPDPGAQRTVSDALGNALPDVGSSRADPKEPPPSKMPEIGGQGFLREFFYDPQEEGDLLPALLSPGEAEPSEEVSEPLEEFLSFRLAAEDYAIEIGEIHEIIKPTAITEVPRSPKAILGVISLRGEALPVFDLHRLLGTTSGRQGAERPGSARVVILNTPKGLAGILVDAVEQVVRLPHGSIEPAPRGLSTASHGAVLKGIGRWQGRLLAILDPAELLQPERRQ